MQRLQCMLTVCVLTASAAATGQDGASATEIDTFSCGQSFVQAGTAAAEVLRLCGEPTTRLAEDQWVYDRGPEQFITTIYFGADGMVDRIDQAPNN